MATYRFRITFEDHDEVSRDIEIKSTQTFSELHDAIHSSIGFDGNKPSSFYMSDDNWKKGKEITSKPIEDGDSNVIHISKAKLCNYIIDPHQKIYYIFDFSSPWTFLIELFKINRDEDPTALYPRTIRSSGDAPLQFSNTGVIPIPDPEELELLDELDFDDEESEEPETEELAIDADELPEGVEKDESFTAGDDADESSEDQFGSEDVMDDSMQDE